MNDNYRNYVMTFDEIFRAIRGGDRCMLVGFAIECAIMLSPVAIFVGAYWFGK